MNISLLSLEDVNEFEEKYPNALNFLTSRILLREYEMLKGKAQRNVYSLSDWERNRLQELDCLILFTGQTSKAS